MDNKSNEFKYYFSKEFKVGFVIFSSFYIYSVSDLLLNSSSVTAVEFYLDFLIFSFPAILALLAIYRYLNPSIFIIHDSYLEGPNNILSPFKNLVIEYKDVDRISIGTDPNSTILNIFSDKYKISICFAFLKECDQDYIFERLKGKLTHIKSSNLVFAEIRGRILSKRDKNMPFANALIFTTLGLMLLYCGCLEYHERQASSGWLAAISASLSAGLVFIIRKRYFRETHSYKAKANFIFCSCFFFYMFTISSFVSFVNQAGDGSILDRRIASVVMDTDESKRRDDKCYYVNDELIKDEEGFRVCSKENPTLDETSVVEIHFKEGNLGQKWITSMSFLDKNGGKSVQVSK